jgi:hypothetical protein
MCDSIYIVVNQHSERNKTFKKYGIFEISRWKNPLIFLYWVKWMDITEIDWIETDADYLFLKVWVLIEEWR